MQWLWAMCMFIGLVVGYQLYPPTELEGNYPATDWVDWVNQPEGVVARNVLSPAADNPLLKDNYVLPGDRLIALDNIPVYRAEVVRFYLQNLEPGSVLLYQVLRKADENDNTAYRSQSFLVVSSYKPTFLFINNYFIWIGYLWIAGLVVLSLIFLSFLLSPFLKANVQEAIPLMVLIIGLVGMYGIELLRRFVLSIDYRYQLVEFEKVSVWFYVSLVVGVTLFYCWFEFKKLKFDKWLLAFIILLGTSYLIGLTLTLFRWDNFRQTESWFEQALTVWVLLSLLPIAYRIAVQTTAKLNQKLAWLCFTGLIMLAVLQLYTWYQGITQVQVYVGIFTHFSLVVPAFVYSRAMFVHGAISGAVSRSLLYLTAAVFTILFFALIQKLLSPFIQDELYRGLATWICLLPLLWISRWVYQRNISLLNRYFVADSRRKQEKINKFIEQIPRYVHTQDLTRDTLNACTAYIESDTIQLIWADAPDLAFDFEAIFQALGRNYWAKSREISLVELPAPLTQQLVQAQFTLLFPIRILNYKNALLAFGNKKKGFFTLNEVETLKRLAQQYQLTVEILSLLEKEKVLVEKNLEAQLIALRAQINPHFLFNTLNSISDLIHHDPAQAEVALEKLAYILRYSLRFSSQNFVSIENEMSLVRNYLDIEQIRFGERLTVLIDLPPNCLAAEIPAYVLQTIVENSIKHGVLKRLSGGVLEIRFWIADQHLFCTIYDNGPGIDPERILKGTGLKNIITRLQTLYPNRQTLQFENTGNGTKVTLCVPLTA